MSATMLIATQTDRPAASQSVALSRKAMSKPSRRSSSSLGQYHQGVPTNQCCTQPHIGAVVMRGRSKKPRRNISTHVSMRVHGIRICLSQLQSARYGPLLKRLERSLAYGLDMASCELYVVHVSSPELQKSP